MGYQSSNERTISTLLSKRVIDIDGCWIWTGAVSKDGYGNIRNFRKQWRVHRIAYQLLSGKTFDKNLMVLHKCDKPLCFNPEHLFQGTPADNRNDCIKKNRHHKSLIYKFLPKHPTNSTT